MKHLSAFLDVIQRSGLVSMTVVTLALDEAKKDRPDLSPKQFCSSLVEKGIVTQWQANHLLKGKHRGFIVGGHKILDFIGKGGHASVYVAEHIALKQRRIIKVLSKNSRTSGTSLPQRFVREAQAAAALNHHNIVKCLDVVTDADISYIVMEYYPGEDLEKYVRREKRLPIGECINYTIQAAYGLAHTQANGMIHRDIKPANLLRTSSGVIKILDLGLAMLETSDDEDASLTQMHNDNLGTADYIAPEQARSSHDVDFRADIYSLGCTLYHLLVGHPPFNEGSIMQRIAKHQTEMPTPIRKLRPECPRAVEQVCWRMIQKDPGKRYQSYSKLISHLNQLLKKPVPNPEQGSDHGLPKPNGKMAAGKSASGTHVEPEYGVVGLEVLEELPPALVDTDPMVQSASDTFSNFGPAVPVQPTAIQSPNMPVPGTPSYPPSMSMPVQGQHRPVMPNPGNPSGSHPPQDPFGASSMNLPQLGATQQTNYAKPKKDAEEEAYQRFVKSERMKMIWVGVGLVVGVMVAIATYIFLTSADELRQENKLPPGINKEG